MESANIKVDEHNIDQIRTYERESKVEMVITKSVAPVPEQNVEPVNPPVSENSTATEDQRRESESHKTPRYVRLNHSKKSDHWRQKQRSDDKKKVVS